jgi:FAD/FMN-containing dehydrogenase
MQIIKGLADIVGAENVSDDPQVLQWYSKDSSLSRPRLPQYVAKPQNTDEIQKVIQMANEHRVPVFTCSSGVHFYGNSIPVLGGIILDLRRMNRILEFDLCNKMVRIEPGVTWGQLQKEMEKQKMMALIPLLPHSLKSVVSSHLEREPMLIPKFEYAGPLVTMEVVLPEGEVIRTGSACVPGFPDKSFAEGVNPGGPGNISWNWLLEGAQGTMGVVTWAKIKVAPRPAVDKTFILPFKRLEDAVALVYNVQRRMLGEECLILNNVNLATILAKNWPADFENLKKSLAPWTVIFISGGGWRRPQEKIEYEEEGLREAAAELHIPDLPTSIPGLAGIERELPSMLRSVWPEGKTYWKFASQGASQDLFFHTKLNRAEEFVRTIGTVAAKDGYVPENIGYYIQPLEYGRACHFESNFSYNPGNPADAAKIPSLFADVAAATLDLGAFYTRPYGLLADLVYDRAASYTQALKKVKNMLDPNHVLAPGRLCF